jgi:hypothetical protein
MAAVSRRPDDRRAGEENRDRNQDRDVEDYRRKEPARAEPARRPQQLNEYFIDGEGILREVLQMEICKYLGAEATCRPGEYNVRARSCSAMPSTALMCSRAAQAFGSRLSVPSLPYVARRRARRPGADGCAAND